MKTYWDNKVPWQIAEWDELTFQSMCQVCFILFVLGKRNRYKSSRTGCDRKKRKERNCNIYLAQMHSTLLSHCTEESVFSACATNLSLKCFKLRVVTWPNVFHTIYAWAQRCSSIAIAALSIANVIAHHATPRHATPRHTTIEWE